MGVESYLVLWVFTDECCHPNRFRVELMLIESFEIGRLDFLIVILSNVLIIPTSLRSSRMIMRCNVIQAPNLPLDDSVLIASSRATGLSHGHIIDAVERVQAYWPAGAKLLPASFN